MHIPSSCFGLFWFLWNCHTFCHICGWYWKYPSIWIRRLSERAVGTDVKVFIEAQTTALQLILITTWNGFDAHHSVLSIVCSIYHHFTIFFASFAEKDKVTSSSPVEEEKCFTEQKEFRVANVIFFVALILASTAAKQENLAKEVLKAVLTFVRNLFLCSLMFCAQKKAKKPHRIDAIQWCCWNQPPCTGSKQQHVPRQPDEIHTRWEWAHDSKAAQQIEIWWAIFSSPRGPAFCAGYQVILGVTIVSMRLTIKPQVKSWLCLGNISVDVPSVQQHPVHCFACRNNDLWFNFVGVAGKTLAELKH